MLFKEKQQENGNIRVNEWYECVRFTNLDNAGKRGKRVEYFSIHWWGSKDPEWRILEEIIKAFDCGDFEKAKQTLEPIICGIRFSDTHFEWSVDEKRGVDEPSAGFKPFISSNDKYSLRVDWNGFTLADLTDHYNEPRFIDSSRQKSGPAKLRKFLSTAKIPEDASYYDVLHMISGAGVRGHSYCAMD